MGTDDRSPKHAVSLLLVLAGVWLVWSGHFDGRLLGLGALSCGLVVWISWRMGIVDDEGQPMSLILRLPSYLLWLTIEVIKANIDVAKRVLDPRMPISPTLARLPAPQHTNLGKVTYANSITLTPGTVSIELDEHTILVHGLSREGVVDLQGGVMAARVCKLEGGA
ncbi:MAG: multicomponent Na+:H+ antiporter subunit E [Myxococcota bacterium]|jgi:multicomponent Na+:H+ antiporter subunit E